MLQSNGIFVYISREDASGKDIRIVLQKDLREKSWLDTNIRMIRCA